MSSPDLLETMRRRPVLEVSAWLEGVSIGEEVEGYFFNWRFFALVAARRAEAERCLRWAGVALRIYEALASRSTDEYSVVCELLHFRTVMILQLGARTGDAILDPERIYDWFVRWACFSLEEATGFKRLPRGDRPPGVSWQMVKIIAALDALGNVSETGIIQQHPELSGWFHLLFPGNRSGGAK